MKLSASNIAWNEENDKTVFSMLSELGFKGIEIAPTRIIKEQPYAMENRAAAINFSRQLYSDWKLSISSMQSLLYGVNERIFGPSHERKYLTEYMFKAIEFAADIECPHLVFGCPRNRNIDDKSQESIGIDFFSNCAIHAEKYGIIIGLEANPSIYGTNYLNTTEEAIEAIKQVNSPALKLNYDLGADLINKEGLSDILEIIGMVSHVHISEPMLSPVEKRQEHVALAELLRTCNYSHWVSLEMKDAGIETLNKSLSTVSEVFKK